MGAGGASLRVRRRFLRLSYHSPIPRQTFVNLRRTARFASTSAKVFATDARLRRSLAFADSRSPIALLRVQRGVWFLRGFVQLRLEERPHGNAGEWAMPRIAAALGVFATLIFCVGFNVVQYPAVWRMVAASTAPPQPSKAPEASAPAQSPAMAKPVPIAVPQRDTQTAAEAISKPAPAVPAMAASMPRVAPGCEGGVCRLPSSPTAGPTTKSAAGGMDRGAPIGWPKDPPPAAKKASAAREDRASQRSAKKTVSSVPAETAPPVARAEPSSQSAGGRDLVPVVRSAKVAPQPANTTIRPADEAGLSSTDNERKMVRRLPPIDNSPPPTLSGGPVASDPQIPIYPSTTVR